MPIENYKESKLTFIITDNNGNVIWNDIKMNSYTFHRTFGLEGRIEFEPDEAPEEYEYDKNLTDLLSGENIEMLCDPFRKIELRKQGLLHHGGHPKLYFFHSEDGKTGYFDWSDKPNLRTLKRTEVEHRVLESYAEMHSQ